MSAPTAATIYVLDVPEHFRFEIRVEGELAGFIEYRLAPGDLRDAFELAPDA
jgi:hypothetical protein